MFQLDKGINTSFAAFLQLLLSEFRSLYILNLQHEAT